MKAKNKKPSARPEKAGASVLGVTVHIHPKFAEFFELGDAHPRERLPNGSRDSDAFVQLAKKLIDLRESGTSLSLKWFDAQGAEISDTRELFDGLNPE